MPEYNREPCPGCGTGRDIERRDGQVCCYCREDLRIAREFKPAYEAATAGLEPYIVNSTESWQNSWGIKPSHLQAEVATPLRERLFALVCRAGVPNAARPERQSGDYDRDHVIPRPNYAWTTQGEAYRRAAPGLQGVVTAVIEEVNRLTEESYRAGVKYGQDVLVQLAKGEIGLSDFDAAADKKK